jgi:hypothetical protein
MIKSKCAFRWERRRDSKVSNVNGSSSFASIKSMIFVGSAEDRMSAACGRESELGGGTPKSLTYLSVAYVGVAGIAIDSWAVDVSTSGLSPEVPIVAVRIKPKQRADNCQESKDINSYIVGK